MALFFDQAWFKQKLEEAGRTPQDLADAMGIPLIDLAAVWKDQRELSASEVRAMARVLGQPVAEVASRAGISTPVPEEAGPGDGEAGAEDAARDAALGRILSRLDDMDTRLSRLERAVADVKALVLDLRTRPPQTGA